MGEPDQASLTSMLASSSEVLAEQQRDWARENGVMEMSADASGHVTAALPRTAPIGAEGRIAAAGNAVRAGGEAGGITVKRSTLVKADIDATRSKLGAFHAAHPAYGFTFHYDAAKDATVVTGNIPAKAAAELRRTAGNVVVVSDPHAVVDRQVGRVGTGVDSALNCRRDSDCGPWHFGGARIRSNGFACTSGFSMFRAGKTYSVTSGHCGEQGSNWWSGSFHYGVMSQRAPYPQWDAAKLDCCENYGNQIWTSATTTRRVYRAYNAAVGYHQSSGECVSGASTIDEKCFASVVSTNANFCDSGGCTYGLMKFERANGSQMTISGDSGAAIFHISSGTAEINGMLVGIAISGGRASHFAEHYDSVVGAFGGQIRSW